MTEPQYNIFLTDKAANAIIKKVGGFSSHVRLGVKGGGCSGFSYVLEFENESPSEKDLTFEFGYSDGAAQILIFVDKKSIKYLNGMTLDWRNSLLDTGFVFNNPNVKSKCGCGTSFEIKEDK